MSVRDTHPSDAEHAVPYINLTRGISQTEHLNALVDCARDAEALGWESCRRYMEHELYVRMSDFKVAERRRVRAELAAEKSERRLAWLLLALVLIVVVLALAGMVTG